eukprot:gnl/MRDRNA2_/MRDRNA2_101055_c0_seq1.p1 gnl/MRDRNA2_/MRDRNA2_101055_c0~~gnl/MRDRNA2_/MRDRNA2_101055_c0_seq1.p1  ORF type:complete len:206 (-),score=59.18 gnl/MRDRNA2_/MRDRNA2_101055_c0_seq1:77-694(-)
MPASQKQKDPKKDPNYVPPAQPRSKTNTIVPSAQSGVDSAWLKEQVQIASKERATLNDQLRSVGAGPDERRDIDWRVPQVAFCKDPKWDSRLPIELNEQRYEEGDKLEADLAALALERSRIELEPLGKEPPPEETILAPGAPYLNVHPNYKKEEDVWERKLSLRTLDEAMRGEDLSKAMPRPVVFAEDYENYREGRYVKDDCPVA